MLLGERVQLRPIREVDLDYLFGAKKQHRIHLVIVPENAASRRVAEKCGFVLEGTVRGAFFNGGRNHDVLLYSLLRTDPVPGTARPRRPPRHRSASDRRLP